METTAVRRYNHNFKMDALGRAAVSTWSSSSEMAMPVEEEAGGISGTRGSQKKNVRLLDIYT